KHPPPVPEQQQPSGDDRSDRGSDREDHHDLGHQPLRLRAGEHVADDHTGDDGGAAGAHALQHPQQHERSQARREDAARDAHQVDGSPPIITFLRPSASESGPWKTDITAKAAREAETSCWRATSSAANSWPIRVKAGKTVSIENGPIIASEARVRVIRATARCRADGPGGTWEEGTGVDTATTLGRSAPHVTGVPAVGRPGRRAAAQAVTGRSRSAVPSCGAARSAIAALSATN